jgi:hypothetical protein
MAEIAATADLLMVGKRTYLVAEVSPATLDAIAAFDARGEDLEVDNVDSCEAREDDLEHTVGWSGNSTEDDEDGDVSEDDDPGEDTDEDRCEAGDDHLGPLYSSETGAGDPEDAEHELNGFSNPTATAPASMFPTLTQQLQRHREREGGAS